MNLAIKKQSQLKKSNIYIYIYLKKPDMQQVELLNHHFVYVSFALLFCTCSVPAITVHFAMHEKKKTNKLDVFNHHFISSVIWLNKLSDNNSIVNNKKGNKPYPDVVSPILTPTWPYVSNYPFSIRYPKQ